MNSQVLVNNDWSPILALPVGIGADGAMRELTMSEIDMVSGAWDWGEFVGVTLAAAMGGAAAGAVAGMFPTPVVWATVAAGAGIGFLAGAASGMVGYTVYEAWSWGYGYFTGSGS